MQTETPTLNLLVNIFFTSMALGYAASFLIAIRDKAYMEILKLLLPFYVFRFILKMEEGYLKKLLAISVMGAFLLFALVSIFRIVIVPQV